ncbi:hypothetical protein [Candidatus Ruminimicrobium bovinum]|uniref:hypothetical protein n=1 Tax=Candidatus Ruminimicrobium bovinum TaxID=3242779 RepID=UPI0039B92467
MDPIIPFIIMFTICCAIVAVGLFAGTFLVSFVIVKIWQFFVGKQAERNVEKYLKNNPDLFKDDK